MCCSALHSEIDLNKSWRVWVVKSYYIQHRKSLHAPHELENLHVDFDRRSNIYSLQHVAWSEIKCNERTTKGRTTSTVYPMFWRLYCKQQIYSAKIDTSRLPTVIGRKTHQGFRLPTRSCSCRICRFLQIVVCRWGTNHRQSLASWKIKLCYRQVAVVYILYICVYISLEEYYIKEYRHNITFAQIFFFILTSRWKNSILANVECCGEREFTLSQIHIYTLFSCMWFQQTD